MEKPKTIWVFDSNYRVYDRAKDGAYKGAPIYREHWRPHKVVSETPRSWVLDDGTKVPRRPKDAYMHGFAFSEEEVEKDVWLTDHAHKLADKVRRATYEQLKAIAEILGYEE